MSNTCNRKVSPATKEILIYTTGWECRSIDDLHYSIELEWHQGTGINENDCQQPFRIGRKRALNGCVGILSGASTQHNRKNSDNKSKRYAKIRMFRFKPISSNDFIDIID